MIRNSVIKLLVVVLSLTYIPFSFSQTESNDLSVRVEVDPLNQWELFTFRVFNNSDLASITSIELNSNDSRTFDVFLPGSSFTVSPDPGGNNEGNFSEDVTLSFSGGLSPGSSDSNGTNSDLDWDAKGLDVVVNFSDGRVLNGAMANVGDSDDSNSDLWVYEGFATEPEPPVVPMISSFSPVSGSVGTEVTVTGNGFDGATDVLFGGVSASSFTVDSDSQLRAVVPAGANSGSIVVKSPGVTATSSSSFTVVVEYILSTSALPTGGGQVTVTPDKASYSSGETVEVSAAASADFEFDKWSGDFGDVDPSNATITLLMDQNRSLTANFSSTLPDQFTLTKSVLPQAAGQVTVTPDKASYSSGETVEVSAVAAGGFEFSNWSGAATGNTSTLNLVMDSDKVVTANFNSVPVSNDLSVRVEVDPLNQWELFTFRVFNNSDLAFITSIELNSNDSRTFDVFLPGSSFTVSPDPGGNNEGNFSEDVTLSFSGGLGPGSSDSNGTNSDLDWDTKGLDVVVNFSDGRVLSGSMSNVGDSDDSNGDLWLYEGFATVPEPPVVPVISSFSPSSGSVGTEVTVTGSGFDGTTDVLFGGVSASSFTVDSNSQLRTVVPTGASSGFVAVNSPGGTATSSSSFTMEYTLLTSVLPEGGGQVTLTPNKASYSSGETIEVSAVASADFEFEKWSGDFGSADSSNATITLVMDQDRSLTANFSSTLPDQYTLTTSVLPQGGGQVTVTPDKASYSSGETVEVTAAALDNFEFSHWSGVPVGIDTTSLVINIVMNATRSVTANFNALPQVEYSLTVSVNPVGSGSVSRGPDKANYADGEVVTLTALANIGFEFSDWSDAVTGNSGSVNLVMDSDKVVTANFNSVPVSDDLSVRVEIDPLNQWELFMFRVFNNSDLASITSIELNSNDSRTFDVFLQGRSFTVSPDPGGNNEGNFSEDVTLSFSGGLSPGSSDSNGTNSDLDWDTKGLDVVVNFSDGRVLSGSMSNVGDSDDSNSDLWLYEGFAATPEPLAVPVITSVSPQSGQVGTPVTINGNNFTGVTAVVFNKTLATNFTVTSENVINANVPEGARTGPVSVTNAAGTAFTATDFIIETLQYSLTISVNPFGAGTININPEQASYSEGQIVNLEAVANAGFQFSNWSGDVQNSVASINLTMQQNFNLVANFDVIPPDPPPPNSPPVPVIQAVGKTIINNQIQVGTNEVVQFIGSQSSDPDGDPLIYTWTFGDGSTSKEADPAHQYDLASTYDVSLSVDDMKWPQYDSNPYVIQLQQPALLERGGIITADFNNDGFLDYAVSQKNNPVESEAPAATIGVYSHDGSVLWVSSVDLRLNSESFGLPGLFGPGMAAVDIDGDSEMELLHLTTTNHLAIRDGKTGQLEENVVLPPVPGGSAGFWGQFQIVNLRGQGDKDVILQADNLGFSFPWLTAFSLDTREVLWSTDQYYGFRHGGFRAVDLDGDGRDEVVGKDMYDDDGSRLNNWQYRSITGHLDALYFADIKPDVPGLEVVLLEESHQGDDRVAICNADQVFTYASRNGDEPQNAAIGDFDPNRAGLEIWLRSRFDLDQRPWVLDQNGSVIAEWVLNEVSPTGWTLEGLETISKIDWQGGQKEFIAAKERHKDGNIAVIDPMTGQFMQWWPENATRMYVADVSGDYREEIIVINNTAGEIRIYWNGEANPFPPKQRLWHKNEYQRQKQNYNYYSP